MKITFSTQIPNLSVLIDPGGTRTDPKTGAVENFPARFAEFPHGTFEPKAEADAVALLRVLSDHVAQGSSPSFAVAAHSFGEAEGLAVRNGLDLHVTRLSAGIVPTRHVGEAEADKNGNVGDDRQAKNAIRADSGEGVQQPQRTPEEVPPVQPAHSAPVTPAARPASKARR